MRRKTPASSPSENNAALPNRHSRKNGNPVGQGAGDLSTPSSSTEPNHNGNETSPSSMSAPFNEETTFTDDIDCYYEPLTPEDQAIFNYNSLIESGEFEEGEINFVPPSEAAHRDYAIALKRIKEAAESECVPLLPNPLAGTLRKPNIRSP